MHAMHMEGIFLCLSGHVNFVLLSSIFHRIGRKVILAVDSAKIVGCAFIICACLNIIHIKLHSTDKVNRHCRIDEFVVFIAFSFFSLHRFMMLEIVIEILCNEGLFLSKESNRVIFLGQVSCRSGSRRSRQNTRLAKIESSSFMNKNPALRNTVNKSTRRNINGTAGITLKNEMKVCI